MHLKQGAEMPYLRTTHKDNPRKLLSLSRFKKRDPYPTVSSFNNQLVKPNISRNHYSSCTIFSCLVSKKTLHPNFNRSPTDHSPRQVNSNERRRTWNGFFRHVKRPEKKVSFENIAHRERERRWDWNLVPRWRN